MFNYKCPNGLPPDECRHIPQLILNAANYFQKKQQQRKAHAKDSNQNDINLQRSTESTSGQKVKRRG